MLAVIVTIAVPAALVAIGRLIRGGPLTEIDYSCTRTDRTIQPTNQRIAP